jgi:hypothetical protein
MQVPKGIFRKIEKKYFKRSRRTTKKYDGGLNIEQKNLPIRQTSKEL